MEQDSSHSKFMYRCLELARKGKGKTGLNPLVGSVIVHNGRIIGEGYHNEYGGKHAEVNAIESVKDKALLKNSTLFVNLEPCSHYGKTPPCSLLISEMGIPEVVTGMVDPNPKVSGRGIKMLRESGIRVVENVLQKECEEINRRFITYIRKGRPFVILKWAQSRDGFIDKLRTVEDPVKPNWITNFTARMLVHKWRGEEPGIMAGVNTILFDNPELNLRNWTGNQPVRVIIDRNNRIGYDFRVFDDQIRTIVFGQQRGDRQFLHTEFVEGICSLSEILRVIANKGINSIMVEGGAALLNSFICEGLWDEARVFTGKAVFENGVPAPVLAHSEFERICFRNNYLDIFRNNH